MIANEMRANPSDRYREYQSFLREARSKSIINRFFRGWVKAGRCEMVAKEILAHLQNTLDRMEEERLGQILETQVLQPMEQVGSTLDSTLIQSLIESCPAFEKRFIEHRNVKSSKRYPQWYGEYQGFLRDARSKSIVNRFFLGWTKVGRCEMVAKEILAHLRNPLVPAEDELLEQILEIQVLKPMEQAGSTLDSKLIQSLIDRCPAFQSRLIEHRNFRQESISPVVINGCADYNVLDDQSQPPRCLENVRSDLSDV